MPYYEEISHIPLMIWHPEAGSRAGTRTADLTQTTDLMPTFLDFYGIEAPVEVTSHSLVGLLRGGRGERHSAIFGMFAGPICVTDGRYTYYRFPEGAPGGSLPLYTVMPSHLQDMFSLEELRTAELVKPFDFTKGVPVLRFEMASDVRESGLSCVANWEAGSCLFDLATDPRQENPIDDPEVIDRLLGRMVDHLLTHDSPHETYDHYGLTGKHVTLHKKQPVKRDA
jgi:hypothetical protein